MVDPPPFFNPVLSHSSICFTVILFVAQSHGPILRQVLGQRLEPVGQLSRRGHKQTEAAGKGKWHKKKGRGSSREAEPPCEQGFTEGWACIWGRKQGTRQPIDKTIKPLKAWSQDSSILL